MGLPERYSLSVPARDVRSAPPAVNPNLVLVLRFLLTSLVCGLALATTIMCLLVVVYYNSNDPIVRPSWGSLIFLIVLGFFTCIIYFGYNIFLPLMPFIRYGDFLYSLFMVKIELLLQFAMCVLWVSGALAYANDLRGYENCQFDGYLHYTEPEDFQHVCDLTNWAVPLAYATFGVQVLLWALETAFGLYLFLFLDQESLSEPHFTWGRRAYDWKRAAKQQQQEREQQAQQGQGPYNNGGPRNYQARAVSAPAAGGARAGRRGSAYRDENDSERASDRTMSASELREEDEDDYTEGYTEGATEMTETQMGSQDRRPLSLGKRGKRGYHDEESSLGQARGGGRGSRSYSEGTGRSSRRTYDDEPEGRYRESQRRRGSMGLGPGGQTDVESSGWHLRE